VRRLDCALKHPRTACRTAVSPSAHLKAVSSGFATLRATALQMIGSLRSRDTIPKWDIILIPIVLSFVQTHFREEPKFACFHAHPVQFFGAFIIYERPPILNSSNSL
jgi:hypothetical protein